MNQLVRGLNLFDSIALVIGTIIGTGVFLKTATMAQSMGNPYWVLAAWIIGGLLSYSGALAYAELGSILPDAGGEYVYLKEAYGNVWAFMYGWMRFWIASPGSIAAYSVGAATFLSAVTDVEVFGGKSIIAISFIAIFSLLNCLSVSLGGKFNSFMTTLKVLMILGLSMGVFFFSKTASFDHLLSFESTSGFAGMSALGAAVLAALWAYDGWNNLSMVAGEIKNPQRNIPLSFGIGLLVILGIYGLTNVAYFYAMPFAEIVTSSSSLYPEAPPVATKAVMSFLGDTGAAILSAAFVFSALSAMNGSILTGARVPFAMARDGLFFNVLAKLSKKNSVPVYSIFIQAIVAMGLALSGTFDQLTDYVVFASWIFYALVTGAVFRLRKLHPNASRSFKVPGYPVVPMIFIIVAILLLFNTIYTTPLSSLIGLGLIGAGIPFYFYFVSKK